jgi:hypothetical protein
MDKLCVVCGEGATHFFGNNWQVPLCENPVCEQVVIDDLNGDLRMASDEMLEFQAWVVEVTEQMGT